MGGPRNLPATVSLFVGSGRDAHHALAACAILSAHDIAVDVVTTQGPGALMPAEAWAAVGGARSVTPAQQGRWEAQGDVIAVCLMPGEMRGFYGGQRALVRAESLPAGRVAVAAGPVPPGDPVDVRAADDEEAWRRPYEEIVLSCASYAVSRRNGGLKGLRFVVTAGGTRQPIDPVRTIANRSSGKMGHALAQAALDRGACVTLITAASHRETPVGAEVVRVSDVGSLRKAVLSASSGADVLIMAAAVSDYRARNVSEHKIKKNARGLTLELETVENFIPEVPGGVLKVGFAAETDTDMEKARRKLMARGFDLLCVNDVRRSDAGFEADTNIVWIVGPDGLRSVTPLLPKLEIGHMILDVIEDALHEARPSGAGQFGEYRG